MNQKLWLSNRLLLNKLFLNLKYFERYRGVGIGGAGGGGGGGGFGGHWPLQLL